MVMPPAFPGHKGWHRGTLCRFLGRQELWGAFARHHGIPDLPLVQDLKTDSSNVALEMAIAGLGCAITLASLAEVHLRPGELSPIRASERLKQVLLRRPISC
jgi:hypothetical protein